MSSASEVESSLISFAGSDSTLTSFILEGGDYFEHFCQRQAIIQGRQLIEGRLLFEEIRYRFLFREKTGYTSHTKTRKMDINRSGNDRSLLVCKTKFKSLENTNLTYFQTVRVTLTEN